MQDLARSQLQLVLGVVDLDQTGVPSLDVVLIQKPRDSYMLK